MKFWVKELWYILCLPLEIFKNLSDFFKSSHILLISYSFLYFTTYWNHWLLIQIYMLLFITFIYFVIIVLDLIQFSSVAQSCLPLCDPMDCSTPGLPVHHQLPEFIQTHVHWVSHAIQPSHLMLSLYRVNYSYIDLIIVIEL